MSNFVNTHVHSTFSLQDSAISIQGMIDKAKAGNQKSIAITDHGTVSGWLEFNNLCVKNNIKPLFGCEFYCVDDYKNKKKQTRQHLIILAKDEIGLKQIQKLNITTNKNIYYKPIIEYSALRDLEPGHLISSSACGFGKIPQQILENKSEDEIDDTYYWFTDTFDSNFYIELQPHFENEFKDQSKINEKLIQLADRVNGKLIITTDAHFVNDNTRDIRVMLQAISFKNSYKDQLESVYKTLHSNYLCSKFSELKDLVNKYNNSLSSTYGYISEDILQECCKNTIEMSDKCNNDIFPKYEKRIPAFTKHNKLLKAYNLEI